MAATRYSEACLVNKMTDLIKLGNIHLNHFPKHEKYGLSQQIRKIKRGINFVGFRTWRSVRFVRKRSMYNFSKALRNLKHNSLISILGNAKRTATHSYFMMKLKQQGVRL